MRPHRFLLTAFAALSCLSAAAQPGRQPVNPDGPFRVKIGECAHGCITVTPGVDPETGTEFPKGTVLHVHATPEVGYAFECGYKAQRGMFAFYTEYPDASFDVVVDGDISVGASFVDPVELEGYRCIPDIVYAKPGVKPLKYDAFIPDGAKKLPGIVIIHGGGWQMNCEDVMKGLARALVRDGKYVAFSIDYRWIGTRDGDATPNTMNQLIEDCYGAILHIREHAAEYGLDPNRLAVTGDSAGGHLCASVATMVERIGDGGFGLRPGVFEYRPTYLPAGMSAKKARRVLRRSIRACAPNYGIFSAKSIDRFVRDLDGDEARAAVSPLDNIPKASKRRIPHWLNRGTEDRTVDDASNREYTEALQAAGQRAEYVLVPGASHAYYDWKPDSATKETFERFGRPYARQMEDFFNSVFYR